MGSSQSSQPAEEEEEEEDEEEAEEEAEEELLPEDLHHHHHHHQPPQQPTGPPIIHSGPNNNKSNYKILLQQEPEILPCHASASPLSAVGTPRGPPNHPNPHPSIRVWDPCHVLLPPPPPPLLPSSFDSDPVAAEFFLITHGECAANLRPDLVTGRWPEAGLTGNGERQARAMAVFLKSQGVRFAKVYSSPLDRSMATAALVCRVNF